MVFGAVIGGGAGLVVTAGVEGVAGTAGEHGDGQQEEGDQAFHDAE